MYVVDKALILDSKTTDEGYLLANVTPIARPGVFPYMTTDGITMQSKLPDELFKASTVDSANAKPVTNDHPTGPVNATNFKDLSVGMTLSDAAVVDNKLTVSVLITDASAIKDVQSGKRELSIGFTAKISPEKGEYMGDSYEFAQRDIKINHLAIVDKGRAGSEVALKLDGADEVAVMVEDSAENNKKETIMEKIVIDGQEIDLKATNAQELIDNRVKEVSDAAATAAKTEAEKAAQTEKSKLEAERDAAKSEAEKLKNEKPKDNGEETKLEGDAFDAAVAERVALQLGASAFLGDSFDFKGKTDAEIKRSAIEKYDESIDLSDKDDVYVDAMFDIVQNQMQKNGYSAGISLNDAKQKQFNDAEDLSEAYKKRANMNKED